jgi:RND family efflux transporter MFP subunit
MTNTAKSALAQAAGDRERAARRLEAVSAMQREGLLSRNDMERAQAELDKANADYRRAEEQLARVQKDLPFEIEQVSADVGAMRAAHEAALDRLEQARMNLSNSVITSTVTGVVMDRNVNPGEVPEPGKPLFTVGRIDEVLIEARVTEEQIGRVRLGETASVTFNAFPNAVMSGSVARIKPVTNRDSKTFDVGVLVPNPSLELKPGLTAFVRIQNERAGLMVPAPAVIKPTGTDDSAVFVVEDGVARLKRVKVSAAQDGWMEVLGGLKRGDQVVAVGHLDLRDGDRVRISDESNDMRPRAASGAATGDAR